MKTLEELKSFPEDFINKIINADCFKVMKELPNGCIDLIITDPPYGMTKNKWDNYIPPQFYFKEFWRLLKSKGTIIIFTQQPFTSEVIMQTENFRYELIWDKVRTSGFLNSHKMPLRSHENILIFYKKLGTYNPQMTKGQKNHSKGKSKKNTNNNYGEFKIVENDYGDNKFPKSILTFSKPHPSIHPTQKSLELTEYLIKTYSNGNDTIFDPFMGSGTTGVACKNLKRSFVGIELDPIYFKIAEDRLKQQIIKF